MPNQLAEVLVGWTEALDTAVCWGTRWMNDVWEMGRINMLKQRKNAVRTGEYSDAKDCIIWINSIGYG